ncbi:radical SAM family heme chaperone HemW [Clostridium formicaceticum]|uniref:Heme chaperone HemW n=1 Tax=Clostridium formicaceticum TaxID=1497 RepID=A0AAC9RM03_9CLOT|nr:radical SAM family heme chaperone HemW [Clostridium formicaceticum]AOY77571.1 coproporphyrinogen III oxidase [Clostridium formicaceticum]ARE88149.1 Oxygen-independent coproporphyrinogen-III oxidase 1 [Clostridium formicaceticum]
MEPLSIYIHIPFCQKKCYYCDFPSYSGKEDFIEDYVKALKKEILLYAEEAAAYEIKTVFIGGGTPSVLQGKHLEKITSTLYKCYKLSREVEFSIEANPGLLNLEKLKSYYHSGINRLSMGLQACQNHLLEGLGRIHRYEDFEKNLEDARKVGFSNINVDLMFSLPNQSIKNWQDSLKKVVDLEIPHISAYSLIIEEDTLFETWLEEGKIYKPQEEVELQMYHDAINYLKSRGYLHYEISNFAKPNYPCNHNITYWKNQQYLGFGAAAHSYFKQERFHNYQEIEGYIKRIGEKKKPVATRNLLSRRDEISETMFLGLRMIEGVTVRDFEARFRQTPLQIYGKTLEKLKKQQLITYNDDFVKLTPKGIDLANLVFQEMLL